MTLETGYYIHSCIKMRYKATFRTQQLLGQSLFPSSSRKSSLTTVSDPCTYTWDLLDDDLTQRLDSRPWVSMSLERAWAIPRTDLDTFLHSDSLVRSHFHEELSIGPEILKTALEYVHGPEANDQNQAQRATTVFEARMPGAMTLEEVKDQINLDRWQLKLGSRLVNLEVRLKLKISTYDKLANVSNRIW